MFPVYTHTHTHLHGHICAHGQTHTLCYSYRSLLGSVKYSDYDLKLWNETDVDSSPVPGCATAHRLLNLPHNFPSLLGHTYYIRVNMRTRCSNAQ